MTTPEQPDAPALTRKQMREIRNTGSNPIIVAEGPSEPAPAPAHHPEPVTHVAPVAPLARAAEPIVVPEPPVPDASVDLGVSPLTRRQARQQERIRTASVPVITPEVAAAHTAMFAAAPAAPAAAPAYATSSFFPSAVVPADVAPDPREAEHTDPLHDLFSPPVEQPVVESVAEPVRSAEAQGEASDRVVVNPLLGAGLLESERSHVALPPSFDELLARSSSGSVGTPNALIISQSSGSGSIVAPVTATGEVLITGTLNLPEGLGSSGHAIGAADGKEVDASLIDGEIPAHSSPTPIAASAAISTVKNSGEIITPPTPDKGSKLMMTLAITAGVLALALVGVLILAFVTGVF
jgi:hypothetical protein